MKNKNKIMFGIGTILLLTIVTLGSSVTSTVDDFSDCPCSNNVHAREIPDSEKQDKQIGKMGVDPIYWIHCLIEANHAAYAIQQNDNGILLTLCYHQCAAHFDDCWFNYYGPCQDCFKRCEEAFGN